MGHEAFENPGPVHAVALIEPATAKATGTTASVKITSHLWIQWSNIAISHLDAARQQRDVGLAVRRDISDQSHLVAEALGDETQAAMVAVSAAAHAIDAFYGACKRFITLPLGSENMWTANRTSRQSRIYETFKAGFVIGDKVRSWPSEFRWLFNIRDAAVHFEEGMRDPVPHPTGTHTAPENVTYSLESAKRAVSLLVDVLITCQAHPKPQHRELLNYVGPMGDAVTRLQASYQEIPTP